MSMVFTSPVPADVQAEDRLEKERQEVWRSLPELYKRFDGSLENAKRIVNELVKIGLANAAEVFELRVIENHHAAFDRIEDYHDAAFKRTEDIEEDEEGAVLRIRIEVARENGADDVALLLEHDPDRYYEIVRRFVQEAKKDD
jgi:hypothetical protein